jgi:hypothetical protein
MVDTKIRGRCHRGPEPWLATIDNLALVGEGGPVQFRGQTWVYWVLGATLLQRQSLQYLSEVTAALQDRGFYGNYSDFRESGVDLAVQVLKQAMEDGELSVQVQVQV